MKQQKFSRRVLLLPIIPCKSKRLKDIMLTCCPDSMILFTLFVSCAYCLAHSYLSMEHVVLEYDLRNATGPIVSTPTRDLSPILQNQDEVNQIDATFFHYQPPHRKGKGNGGENQLYLATADDAGTIRFMEATSSKSQVLHHDPNGVAVVPTCAFRPGTKKSMELASGGTDCKIHLWDLSKPK